MANLIRHGRIESGNWPRLDADALTALATQTQGERDGPAGVLIPFQLWRTKRDVSATLGTEVGVLVGEEDDLTEVAAHLAHTGLIAVHFPRFTNGRGYSIARLLRGRYGYRGELRAVGDIMRDQLFYLRRVGFDAFELRADQACEQALHAFEDFTQPYQASSDEPTPLFRRRLG
jgi:uncharacterized protein (DUF934 family)